jgi:two-component system, NarL family, sensor kinase
VNIARAASSLRASPGSPARRPVKVTPIATRNTPLAESKEALRAIRDGEVDAVLLAGKDGNQVFTLQGAEHAYRMLIESMNEGALTLTTDKLILYANGCFAHMVKCPLEQVIGSSFRRFVSVGDRASLRPMLGRAGKAGSKVRMVLNASDGSRLPVQISIRPLAKNGLGQATIGMVVTDMSEAQRSVEMLRALTHRVVQVQEEERGRVALELHDNITQLLCAVLFRSQTLAEGISASDKPAKQEAAKLRELLGRTADEVERISRDLRPSLLEHLGLVEVLRNTAKDFTAQAGVAVRLDLAKLVVRLPADTELALYRIIQEALKNVEKHASARHVTVTLKQRGTSVQLMISDDGIGFDARPSRNKTGGLGLLGMRERATYLGGILEINTLRHAGTSIRVQIPLRLIPATHP